MIRVPRVPVDPLGVRGPVRVVDVARERGLEGPFDLLHLVPGLLVGEVEELRPDQEHLLPVLPAPDPAHQVRRELDQAPCLPELLVLLEEGEDVLVARVERVGADDLVRHLLGGFRQRPAPDRLLVGGEIGLGHPVHLLPVRVREPGEEAFTQDVVDLPRVQVDRGDGLRAAARLLLEVRELPAQDPARVVIGGVQGGDHDHAALELHRRGEQVGDRVFQQVQ